MPRSSLMETPSTRLVGTRRGRGCFIFRFRADFSEDGTPRRAFEASAELLLRRALTSIIQYLSVLGSRAYWMLHSPTIPMCRMTFRAVLRNLKYSRFDKVWEGATTIESPVWTPSGSKFSMLQTVMQLSRTSRTTCARVASLVRARRARPGPRTRRVDGATTPSRCRVDGVVFQIFF